ncbi:hypothetical protein [Sulfurovum sp.]|jgi:hypothetical protein|uniref:hypothetical protein n=1 Tax=Sulfurovum sp. TaxID=1969726 RepID=UPI002A36D650|nr:hypothetical protein [Sulfurovum sp.]MDD2451818.1 hypothetical protein [Sulfurovum sp.]MDD3499989.1 hypothetical protein [Sulfurovum sp.]MDY0402665.1 hypothetical protein [Sulfurovum sp.]
MIDFLEVSGRIRTILHTTLQKEKIYDRDIAHALDLDPQYYAVIKKRKKIPYEAIALFCQKHKISMNWILFNQKNN